MSEIDHHIFSEIRALREIVEKRHDKLEARLFAIDDEHTEELTQLKSRFSAYENQAKGAWRIVSVLGVVISGAVSTLIAFLRP